jgi:hypothetical protein
MAAMLFAYIRVIAAAFDSKEIHSWTSQNCARRTLIIGCALLPSAL